MSDDLDTHLVDPLIGTVIQDSFRIDKKLGQGGMGAIYLAEHLRLKKKVAIKCLHAGIASNPEVVRRFKNEAVAASAIGHAHIINVMDMGQFGDGTFFMVLEFLEGQDWQHQLDETGPQSPAHVAHIGVQICAALGAAAAKGIVHRDMKPENIFLTEKLGNENFVKILDFGISKILDSSGSTTKTGALMGTPYYMAPEQVLGQKEITHLADVYALGVIFYQALSGGVPFEGETLAQIVMKTVTEPVPSLAKRVPGTPVPLSRLVAQMMQKEPSARPQTFEEVATRLLPFLSESSPFYSASQGAKPVDAAHGSVSHLALRFAELSKETRLVIAAAVLLAAGWFVFALVSSSDDPDLTSTPETAGNRKDLGAKPPTEKSEQAEKVVAPEKPVRSEKAPSAISPAPAPAAESAPSQAPTSKPAPATGSSPKQSPSPESEKVLKPIKNLGRSIQKLF